VKNIPVDTSKMSLLIAGAIIAATTPDGSARRDQAVVREVVVHPLRDDSKRRQFDVRRVEVVPR